VKTYWLIEKGSPAEYYVAGHTPNIVWTRDPAEATRFTSERTANWGIYGCFSSSEAMLDRVRVCEHVDIRELNHARTALERECDDSDAILRLLGLDPDVCRSEGGAIMLHKVREQIQAIKSLV